MIPVWYLALVGAVGLDRLIAVGYSRLNQRRLGAAGSKKMHDPAFAGLAALHTAYLIAAPVEVGWLGRPFLPWLGVPAAMILVAAVALRFWAVRSLAEHWNLSVVASQNRGPVTSGPYRWIRHPNYVAIILELAALPLVHTAWLTALVATLLQVPLLARRIAVEEQVLMSDPVYRQKMGHKPRFLPYVAAVLFIAALAHGQAVHGSTSAGATVHLLSVDRSEEAAVTRSDSRGAFRFPRIDPGRYILSVEGNQRRALRAIDLRADLDAGKIALPAVPSAPSGVQVLDVCEALENRDRYDLAQVVIVGIFKSGIEETLRADCPTQLTTGGVAWMNAISLPASPSSASTSPVLEQPEIRQAIEKKRAEILSSAAPGTEPRPERIIALYGRLSSASGLSSVSCAGNECSSLTQLNLAPLKLLNITL